MLPAGELTVLVSALVAGAGLILSAVKYIDKRREKKFRVNVTLKHGWPTYANGTLGAAVLLIEAMNPGSRCVTLTSYGILLPNKGSLVFPSDFGNGNTLPYALAAGKNCTKWMDTLRVTEALLGSGWQGKIKLVGFYGDALGKKYKSKPLNFDIAMWQKIAADKK